MDARTWGVAGGVRRREGRRIQAGGEAGEVLEVGAGGLVAASVADMRAWLALQAFLTALLPAMGAGAFRRWAHTFTLQMARPPLLQAGCRAAWVGRLGLPGIPGLKLLDSPAAPAARCDIWMMCRDQKPFEGAA